MERQRVALCVTALVCACGGSAPSPSPLPSPEAQRFTSIAAAEDHTCAVANDQRILCWGSTEARDVGSSVQDPKSTTPTAVATTTRFAAISAGAGFDCAVSVSGAAFCWGTNTLGQLGDGSHEPRIAPVAVASPAGVRFTTLAAGLNSSCAVASTGRMFCWGNNGAGALGNGEHSGNRPTPVAINSTAAFSKVSAGNNTSCALDAQGAAYCWGLNTDGQLGRGIRGGYRMDVVPVSGTTRFTALATAGNHTCALTGDGSAFCWGGNVFGVLGNGDTTASLVPAPVSGGLHFRMLSASYYSMCGVTLDAATYCWGAITHTAAPLLVATDARLIAIAVGRAHACGLTRAGDAYCWGVNNAGQLGIGTTVNSPVPVRVASLAAVAATDVSAARAPAETGTVYFEFQVERRVTALPGNPAARYPDSLRTAGVEGSVLAQFVVDTAGRADLRTFTVLKSTHELFTQAVRIALADARFSPAQLGGRTVRQLVQQPFLFSVTPAPQAAAPPAAVEIDTLNGLFRLPWNEREPDASCDGPRAGTTCLQFADGYRWIVADQLRNYVDAGHYHGDLVRAARGEHADYYHVIGTKLTALAPRGH